VSSSTYRTVLRTPGAAAFFATATVGRVGIAMTSLGLVWLVHARTGSYTLTGIVTGSFAVAEAVAGPQVARLIDRLGQTRTLPPLLLAHATAMAALLGLVTATGPVWSLAAGGGLAGATIPQLGALSAARWSCLLHGDAAAALPTAFSLESLSNGTAYLAGPVLVSAVAATGQPALGTVLAAALIVGGGLALAAQHRTAPPPTVPGGRQHTTRRSLLGRAFVVLVGVNLGIGAYFGAIQVSVTAFAVESGAPGSAAPLYAVVQLRRPARRLAVRAAPVAAITNPPTGPRHHRAHARIPAAPERQLTDDRGSRTRRDRTRGPSDPGRLLGAGPTSCPPDRSHPGVHLAQLRRRGRDSRNSRHRRPGHRHPRQSRRLHHRRHSRHHHRPSGGRTPDHHHPTSDLTQRLQDDIDSRTPGEVPPGETSEGLKPPGLKPTGCPGRKNLPRLEVGP